MTTIVLNDNLMNQIIQIGDYQSAQEAVEKILSDYMKKQTQAKTAFDSLCMNLDMDDEEIDNLFHRSKDAGRMLDL